jgi:hypothetical protein
MSLNSGNACYHSVQKLLSFRPIYKDLKIKTHKNTILPVVLHGYETWSLTVWKEQRLRVFENRALSTVFGPKREDAVGGWGGLHNNLYASHSIIKVIKVKEDKMEWECSTHRRNADKTSFEKP